jgi:asparagine synthase (glutamine-hydrolysing)
VANDRFGLRPLYYNHCGNEFVFSSEVKAILKYNGVRKTINPAGLADFFHLGFLTGNKTFFSGIEMLPPSTVLTFESGHLTMKKYWDLAFLEESEALTESDYIEQLADVIKDCVRVNMEGGFRFGLP